MGVGTPTAAGRRVDAHVRLVVRAAQDLGTCSISGPQRYLTGQGRYPEGLGDQAERRTSVEDRLAHCHSLYPTRKDRRILLSGVEQNGNLLALQPCAAQKSS